MITTTTTTIFHKNWRTLYRTYRPKIRVVVNERNARSSATSENSNNVNNANCDNKTFFDSKTMSTTFLPFSRTCPNNRKNKFNKFPTRFEPNNSKHWNFYKILNRYSSPYCKTFNRFHKQRASKYKPHSKVYRTPWMPFNVHRHKCKNPFKPHNNKSFKRGIRSPILPRHPPKSCWN